MHLQAPPSHASSDADVATSGHASSQPTIRNGGHPGRRRAEKKKRSGFPWQGLGLLAAAVVGSVAWFFLVRSAIDFGRAAMDGQQIGWLFTVAATAGATACLVLVFSLVHRAMRAFGLVSEHHGHRAAGRHGKQ